MKKNVKNAIPATILTTTLILIWAVTSELGLIPKFMLPSPIMVFSALFKNLTTLFQHAAVTLFETIIGLIISIFSAFFTAVLMDKYAKIKQAIYPLLVVTQTVPTVAVAPIIVLFFGYGILPKIILVVICCFFPITIAFFDGLTSVPTDYLNLLKGMRATYTQTLIHLKIPFAVPHFFSGLKISGTYAFISAVVAEWLGGSAGLGVYMTRVKSAYSFDKLFAAIIFISIISFAFIQAINFLQKMALTRLHMAKRG